MEDQFKDGSSQKGKTGYVSNPFDMNALVEWTLLPEEDSPLRNRTATSSKGKL